MAVRYVVRKQTQSDSVTVTLTASPAPSFGRGTEKMPRRSEDEVQMTLVRIEQTASQYPEGVSRRQLQEAYEEQYGELEVTDRTFRRWLKRLVEDDRLRAEGEKRGRTYFPVEEPEAVGLADEGGEGEAQEDGEGEIPLSETGRELQRHVRQPRARRDPVAYDREFLERYEPGRTRYLPGVMREALLKLGETPDPDRPAGTYAEEMLGRLLIDLSWASSRLEGNTYSRLDTANLIRFGQEAEGKDPEEAQMILNHRSAIEFLVENAEELRFDRRTILALHAHLSENLLGDPGYEGTIRDHAVDITGTTYTPTGIPQVIEECFDLLVEKADAIPDPFEQAFFVMVHIPYLQPFTDVNKRTSRLAANLPLIRHNLKPLSFIDVPQEEYIEGTIAVYEKRRTELLRDVFRWAYERSAKQYRAVRQAMGDPDPIRLRYREAFGQLIRDVVRSGGAPQRSQLLEWADRHDIDEDDRRDFVETALSLLLNLGEGGAARYRLRPGELEEWRETCRDRLEGG